MNDEARIHAILVDLMRSGATPDSVLADEPELLSQVKRRWLRIRALETEIDALFPDPAARPTQRLPTLANHEVLRELGRGGMGIVYEARDLRLQRSVAVKMLIAGEFAVAEQRARFQREAEAVAALAHPNVVQIHDLGECDGRPYFTMELLTGGTLAQRIAEHPLSPKEAAKLLMQLADAMATAHERCIVHRDLKPSNILFAADGLPKIVDFGLARQLAADSRLTLPDVPLGTPSYMAPEQARGDAAIGPAADIYALGAILYESLTGVPPFRAATAAEALRRIETEDPTAPTQWDRSIPRELELITLMCLEKDPGQRYPAARALAADLRRFLFDEPIEARPIGAVTRARKWTRRHPLRASALVAVIFVLASIGGARLWWVAQRSHVANAASSELNGALEATRSEEWAAARLALERARATLGNGRFDALRERIATNESLLQMVAVFDRIRVERGTIVDGRYDLETNERRADAAYETAFREGGFGDVLGAGDPELPARRVAESPVRRALVRALDDWAACARDDESRRNRLLEVSKRADPDPTGWRERARDAENWEDRDLLEELTSKPRFDGASIPLLLGIADRLERAGGDPVPFLRAIQQQFPADYCVNASLGLAVAESDLTGAVRYFQAAVALRPSSAVAHMNLGVAFGKNEQAVEAESELRLAITLDPTLAVAYTNLGNVLVASGRREEAIEAYQESIRRNDRQEVVYANLGKTLLEVGRQDEALALLRAAVERRGKSALLHSTLGLTLRATKDLAGARAALERAVELDPLDASAHGTLARVLAELNDVDRALEHAGRAVELRPSDPEAHSVLASILEAASRPDEAIAELREAVRLAPKRGVYHGRLARLLAMRGWSSDAIDALKKAAELGPVSSALYVNLGKALANVGRDSEAATAIESALALEPDRLDALGAFGVIALRIGRLEDAAKSLERCLEQLAPNDVDRDLIESSLARCRALAALEPRLEAFVAGAEHPSDAKQSLLLAELCRLRGRYVEAVRFARDAFTADTALASDPTFGYRFEAACAAALAGAGDEREGAAVENTARRDLRRQAREWLLADLKSWNHILDELGPKARPRIINTLERWRASPRLAVLRDQDRVDLLDEAERSECRALWREVDLLHARAEITK